MSDHIDEFQSIFKGSERRKFAWVNVPIRTVAVITDVDSEQTGELRDRLRAFLPRLPGDLTWRLVAGDEYASVAELLNIVDETQTDLIVTFRHLQERSLVPQHSLGVYLDMLTQTTSIPVLVLPGTGDDTHSFSGGLCQRVMVVADHISGDSRLINYGVRLCQDGGNVWLCHIEDGRTFERYMHVIERIPEIDTSDARTMIARRLRKDAEDFLRDCVRELTAEGPRVTAHTFVRMGHHLRQYRELVEEHDVDLLVINTKDDDQLAMHGRAYSLAVELTDVPMLML